MTDTFLPQGYREPSFSNYMKFSDGENTFRVLSDAIVGWEWWEETTNEDGNKGRKPVRVREFDEVPVEVIARTGKDKVKHFWAFVVYNVQEDRIQILEITQSSIRDGINTLIKSKSWGDPKGYDIVITKTGEDLETKYNVMPAKPTEVKKEIVSKYKAMNINLEAMYEGKDPFENIEKSNIDEVVDAIPID